MPVMLRGFIPEDEWLVLAELSYFFRVLCAKELSPGVLEEMEELAPELICKLEKIFPPGFFNPMQHLILHLLTEARLGGPVQNRWCYPTERMQKTLRQKCKNKRRIEASMAEAFITQRRQTSWQHTTKPKIVICIIRSLGTMLTTLKRVDPTSAYSKGISHQPVFQIQYLWITNNGGPFRCISSTTW